MVVLEDGERTTTLSMETSAWCKRIDEDDEDKDASFVGAEAATGADDDADAADKLCSTHVFRLLDERKTDANSKQQSHST